MLDWKPGSGGYSADWLVYDHDTMFALDPTKTYLIDETQSLPQDRFHITAVPNDFALYNDPIRDIQAQNMGDDYSWHKVVFTGHGKITMAVPDSRYVVFLNGQPVPIDCNTKTAQAQIDADDNNPAVLIAFKKSDTPLTGLWAKLPWQRPKHMSGTWMLSAGGNDAKDERSFFHNVSAYGVILGKLPQAQSIRIKGKWKLRDEAQSVGDAVIRINGQEVLHLPCGSRPFTAHDIDQDISDYAGQYILFEFSVDGERRGSYSDWRDPTFIVEP